MTLELDEEEINRVSITALREVKKGLPQAVAAVLIVVFQEEDGDDVVTSMTNTTMPPGVLEMVLRAEHRRIKEGLDKPTKHKVSKAGEIFKVEEP